MDRREFLKGAFAVAALSATGNLAFTASGEKAGAASQEGERGKMKVVRRRYRDTDLTLPLLGYGTMRLPQSGKKIDDAQAQLLIDRAMEAGVNYFDTAWPYHGGKSEEFVGRALSKYPRESYFLATKLPLGAIGSLDDAERIFNTQLEKCKTKYFDFYLLHAVNGGSWNDRVKRHGLYEFLLKKKEEGKIRHIGFSFHDSPEVLKEIAAAYKWDFVLLQINYHDWYGYRSREQYEIATANGIPVMVMEPLRGGSLATLNEKAVNILKAAEPDASPASWAFRYVGSLPNVVCILSGMTTRNALEDNIKTFANFKELSDSERRTLDSALAAYKASDSIPCTACEYCIPCPVGINIPGVFAAYNKFKVSGDKAAAKKMLADLFEGGDVSQCVKCGACEKKCPQKINIPLMLAKAVAEIRG